jgi:hypothetical protein
MFPIVGLLEETRRGVKREWYTVNYTVNNTEIDPIYVEGRRKEMH